MIKQLTVFLPNDPGTLIRVSRALGAANIQVLGIMVADSSDFSCVRLLVDRPLEGKSVLAGEGFQVELSDVLVIEVPDVPGGFAVALNKLASAELNIGYVYSANVGGRVLDVVRVTGDPVRVKLASIGFTGIPAEELGITQ